jgi:replicative DNA helicase
MPLTDGLHPGQMFVIAARPSMGKTALAMSIVEHVAVDEKIPSVIFSLEMISRQLSQRILCSRARVSLGRVRDGFMREQDFQALTNAGSQLAESPLLIDDAVGLTLQDLAQRLRFYVETHGIRLAIIDPLQLLHSEGRITKHSREAENSTISAGIKTLVMELNIPIIVLVGLNRLGQKNKPRLRDLGSIDLDADVVTLLVRDEYYSDSNEELDELPGKSTLIVAKDRNGRVGEVPLTFIGEYVRFESRSQE